MLNAHTLQAAMQQAQEELIQQQQAAQAEAMRQVY
jgi:hypothetical protein